MELTPDGFYAYGTIENSLYVVLILFSILINYWVGRAIEEKSNDRRAFFLIGLIYNFGWLFVFKYADFFAENLNFILALALCESDSSYRY